MPKSTTNTANPEEELTRSFSRLSSLSRSIPHMIEMARLMADVMASADSADADSTASTGQRGSKEPMALVVQANAMLLSSVVRSWLRWQELVSQHVPAISRDLAAIRANPKRKEELRARLVNSLRAYVREMSELPCHQCRLMREDVIKLEAKLFAGFDEKQARRRWKAKA